MVKNKLRLVPFVWIAAALLAAGFALASAWNVRAGQPAQETEEYCLRCHGNPDLTMTLPSGEELSLYVSPEELNHSIHSLVESFTMHHFIPFFFEFHKQFF